jgi:DNA replication and repair protein RecF
MITNIELKNFRLFDSKKIETDNSLVILSGKNATGKTTILEGIYLSSTTKSHRTTNLDELIKNDKDFSSVVVTENKKYKTVISKDGKSFYINSKEITNASEFIGNLKVVMFSPYDLELINGSKGPRRRFLDLEISLLDKVYLNASMAYKRLLKERNELLKSSNEVNLIALDVLTKQLIEELEVISNKRNDFIKLINNELIEISKELNVEEISLEYERTYSDDIYESFKLKEKYDIISKTTNIGAHRDDFVIKINDKKASSYASEGQIRTIIIAIKLAIKNIIEKVSNIEPIILLDDVFAALDQTRIMSLIKYLKNAKQAFITTASILDIPDELLKDALVIRI